MIGSGLARRKRAGRLFTEILKLYPVAVYLIVELVLNSTCTVRRAAEQPYFGSNKLSADTVGVEVSDKALAL